MKYTILAVICFTLLSTPLLAGSKESRQKEQLINPPKALFEILKPALKVVEVKLQGGSPDSSNKRYFGIPSTGKIYEVSPSLQVMRVIETAPWKETPKKTLQEWVSQKKELLKTKADESKKNQE